MFWECKNSFIKCQYRFWHQYEQTSNPNDKIAKALLKVVRRHLTPPPSSTNVERLFSYEGLVATDHRSSLSGEKLDQILFLRENALMANFNLGWLWEGYLSTSMYIFSYCVTYKYINWLELCIEYWIWILYFNKLYWTSGTKGLSQFIKPGGPLVSIYIVTHITNIISGSFFLWSWSQEVISIMPEFPAKKILIFELYSLLMVNWFRFLWTHSMILSTQFCIDSKTKKKSYFR